MSDAVFLRACRGEAVPRTPVWLMRQAGRYLPEYRAYRERYDFLASCRTPEIACELTLQPVRRLGVDAAIVFSDILVPLPGMGIDVSFAPRPRLARTIRSPADVDSLRLAPPAETTPFLLETIALVRRELDGRVPVIGFAGAPFTLAAYLVEGGGTRTFEAAKALLFRDPATAHRLLAICAEVAAASLVAQAGAGAQAVMLFDSWAGILSPEDDREFAIPYARRVFDAVAANTPGETPPRLYYAGDGSAARLDRVAAVGADVVGVDWRIDLGEAKRRLGPTVAVQGNLDPAALLAPVAAIRARTAAILAAARCGHIFNLGHGVLPSTPPEHARALVECVAELSAGGRA
jgi:uroporphyrinogen decarboxylase